MGVNKLIMVISAVVLTCSDSYAQSSNPFERALVRRLALSGNCELPITPEQRQGLLLSGLTDDRFYADFVEPFAVNYEKDCSKARVYVQGSPDVLREAEMFFRLGNIAPTDGGIGVNQAMSGLLDAANAIAEGRGLEYMTTPPEVVDPQPPVVELPDSGGLPLQLQLPKQKSDNQEGLNQPLF